MRPPADPTHPAPAGLHPVRGDAAELLALLRDWDAAEAEPEPLVIETSGSTGRPKRVRLSRVAMRASADATHARLGGPGQWVLNLPPTYVAGVQVLFRSVRAGTEPALQLGARLSDTLDAVTGSRRYLSLVPTQLVRLLEQPAETAALSRLDAVLVGGGPLRPEVRARAEAAGVPVVQTYGMSESCGGCVYDGYPLDGVAVKIDATGEVLLAGPMLFDSYDGDPERTAEVLVDGWLRTHDLGTLDDDGRLRILGRTDDIVISGGVKVPATAVQQMLEEHPRVREAAVAGVPDEEWGERVVAVLTLAAGGDPEAGLLAELRDLVAPRTWAPQRLVVVDSMPRLPGGKIDRLAVREVAADA